MKHQSPNPVHPRLRGELRMRTTSKTFHNGSSPLTRGTLSLRYSQSRHLAVHPRLRGELEYRIRSLCNVSGSSPLTRGTRNAVALIVFFARFIPAYAGNSLKQGIEHLTNSSKDFLSGKYAKNPETVLNHFKNSSLD